MRIAPFVFVLAASLATATGQERAAPQKPPTFPEAVDQAKRAVDGEKYGAAIAALQAAISDMQKKQRAAVIAGLPKPAGFEIHDDDVDESAAAFNATLIAGASVTRHYRKGDDTSIDVEVTANSPVLQMLAMMFNNPALITADGGEVVKYGAHKAILKKSGDKGQELQILMYDKHLIKVTSQGLTADELLKVFDQAFVDRMEKPLGS
jgi:hypothetical protein